MAVLANLVEVLIGRGFEVRLGGPSSGSERIKAYCSRLFTDGVIFIQGQEDVEGGEDPRRSDQKVQYPRAPGNGHKKTLAPGLT